MVDGGSEFPQGLGHQPGLQADVGVAHIPLDFRLRHQGGHAVHHNGIHGAAPHQLLGDVQGLLAAVGLGNEQFFQVQAAVGGVGRVKGVFGVHIGGDPALFLGFGHNVDGQGGLAGGLAAIDLGNPPPGDAAGPQGNVQGQGTGGNNLGAEPLGGLLAQAHYRAFAVIFLNAPQGDFQGGHLVLLGVAGHNNPSFAVMRSA